MIEAYDHECYAKTRYISCVSKENAGNFQGRVSDYVIKYPFEKESLIYLCGNSQMINDVKAILSQQGFNPAQMFNEIYF